jgi:hypothetical protein
MQDIHSAMINTAGAYVSVDGVYPFMLGHIPYNNHLPIVRLGGHREAGETGWHCAVREVYEETGMHIRQVASPKTYLVDSDDIHNTLQEIRWVHETDLQSTPLLVRAYRADEQCALSLMYLAEADEIPVPSSEVRGLLLLKPEDIHWICREPPTLGQYLARGGQAILKEPFDQNLILEPFIQLRIFAKILQERPEIF